MTRIKAEARSKSEFTGMKRIRAKAEAKAKSKFDESIPYKED